MDIQVSSNFERLLFEAHGRDAAAVRAADGEPRRSRVPSRSRTSRSPRIRGDFAAAAVDEDDGRRGDAARPTRDAGYLLDPHTRRRHPRRPRRSSTTTRRRRSSRSSTAHPAKFPDAVERATGVRPALPPHLADLMDRPERFTRLPNDQAAVERFIRERARVVTESAA